jgi:ribosomal protein S18 acetylase RimI-like enzyme
MEIIAHTMEYIGKAIDSDIIVHLYRDDDYDIYKSVYVDCFREMRTALKLSPICCCDSREQMLEKRNYIYIYETDEGLIASVSVYNGEIDDLVVRKSHRCKGIGTALLRFAIHLLQQNQTSHILLHVADWNKNAVELYLKSGFEIIRTEIV